MDPEHEPLGRIVQPARKHWKYRGMMGLAGVLTPKELPLARLLGHTLVTRDEEAVVPTTSQETKAMGGHEGAARQRTRGRSKEGLRSHGAPSSDESPIVHGLLYRLLVQIAESRGQALQG